MRSHSSASARADAPLRLADVPALVKQLTGHQVTFKTVYRWTKKGRRGVRLELLPDPLFKRTSVARVERFLARLSAKGNEPPPPEVDRSLKRDQRQKHRELAAAGR